MQAKKDIIRTWWSKGLLTAEGAESPVARFASQESIPIITPPPPSSPSSVIGGG